jgi:23S rRNA (adenine2503-C2)-methyltransferase
VHVLRDGPDAVRAEPDSVRDLDQALHFRRIERVDHAVFMGMGEPMLNLDAALGAACALPDVGITCRRTTISTVGWLPGLRRFVDEVDEPIRLALSLHARRRSSVRS